MKLLRKNLLLAVIIGLTTSSFTSVFAQTQGPVFTFDELGNFTIDGVMQAPGVRAVDPVSGFTTLCYRLPIQVLFGDVVIIERDDSGTIILTDLIRFAPDGNLYFFSEQTV